MTIDREKARDYPAPDVYIVRGGTAFWVQYDVLMWAPMTRAGDVSWEHAGPVDRRDISDELGNELAIFVGQFGAALPEWRATQALVNLAGYGRIAVAYLDREVIERTLDRTFTEEEWRHFSAWLQDYDQWVSETPDLNRAFLQEVLKRAGKKKKGKR